MIIEFLKGIISITSFIIFVISIIELALIGLILKNIIILILLIGLLILINIIKPNLIKIISTIIMLISGYLLYYFQIKLSFYGTEFYFVKKNQYYYGYKITATILFISIIALIVGSTISFLLNNKNKEGD